MNLKFTVTGEELSDILLNIAPIRPVFSDALKSYDAGVKEVPEKILRVLAFGAVSSSHAGSFLAFVKQLAHKDLLSEIIKGEAKFPAAPEQRDVLYFVAQSFRAKLLMELPKDKQTLDTNMQGFVHRAKAMIKELSHINLELAQMVVSSDDGKVLPEWFMVETSRLHRLNGLISSPIVCCICASDISTRSVCPVILTKIISGVWTVTASCGIWHATSMSRSFWRT